MLRRDARRSKKGVKLPLVHCFGMDLVSFDVVLVDVVLLDVLSLEVVSLKVVSIL